VIETPSHLDTFARTDPTLSDILTGSFPAKNPPVKVLFEPGTQYHYSGASFTVLQKLIEDVVEIPFEDYMNSVILQG